MPYYSQSNLETMALEEFDCRPLQLGHKPEKKERVRRRQTVQDATAKFSRALMNNPELSKTETLRTIIGVLRMMLAPMFPQIALAIAVLEFLWDLTHQQPGTVIVSVNACASGQLA